jgi:Na+/H+-dicarboxylate symporter
MPSNRLTRYILVGLVLGIVAGYAMHSSFPTSAAGFAENTALLPMAFLRLIKMIIAPLVFSTLVVGIAKMGDIATVGRVGGKALGWFIFASLISLTLGLVLVQLFEPGHAMKLPIPEAASSGVQGDALTLSGFISHTIPTSVLDAMARNEILQIVVFSVFFGTAMAALGERTRIVIDMLDAVSHIMLKVTGYVMLFAPLAVFGALTSTVAKQGLDIIGVYGVFIGEYYLGLIVLWIVLACLGAFIIGGGRVLRLIQRIREPIILAFSTASSEAAYPKTLEELERFGCSNRVASFVLPMGYSFNLDGSMMYQTFAVMFIAQVYGVELSLGQQILMLAVLMLTSKGIAGVPRASLVVVAATLPQFNIPEAGMVLLLGIDHFLDMGRSATNVIGNSIATAVVSKWEGELRTEEEVEAAAAA